LPNLSPCLIGMEACVGAHHLSRKLQLLQCPADASQVRAAVPAEVRERMRRRWRIGLPAHTNTG